MVYRSDYLASGLRPFRFWVQSVLPLVYDDSLSYYELLCKVVDYINAIIGDINKLTEENKVIIQMVQELKEYVDNYFDTTDFQELVDNKLDEMVEDGTLAELISQVIGALGYYNVMNYGATGDGITDDSTSINSLIQSIDGGTVFFPAGNYKINNTILGKSNVELYFADGAVIDATDCDNIAIRFRGTLGEKKAITAPVVKNSYQITAPDGNFQKGELVQIGSETDYYTYHEGYDVKKGQIARVFSYENGVLTLDTPIYDVYSSGDNFVAKINTCKNVRITNCHIIGNNTPNTHRHGLYFDYCENVHVSGCNIEGFDYYSIGIISTVNGFISNNRIRGTYYDGIVGVIFYGICCANSSQWITVNGNVAEQVRHLFVCTAYSQTYYGQPTDITITGNVAQNMMGNGEGRSWAYEHHGFGRNILFDGNIADGCYAGFNVEGSNVVISNNIVRHYYKTGILVSDSLLCQNITIIGNDISEQDPANISEDVYGIDLQNSNVMRDIFISNNRIQMNTERPCAGIHLYSAIAGININIVNNIISNMLNTNTSPGLYLNANDSEVIGNILKNCGGMIISGSGYKVIKDNVMRNSFVPNGYQISLVDCNYASVCENTIITTASGINVASGCTNNIIINNLLRVASAGNDINDSGSNTRTNNNFR